jgi:hypothetical protein
MSEIDPVHVVWPICVTVREATVLVKLMLTLEVSLGACVARQIGGAIRASPIARSMSQYTHQERNSPRGLQ